MSLISGIVEGVLGAIKEPVIEWQKRKTLEVEQRYRELDRDHEARMKKIDVATELAKQGIQVEADWDARAQEGMKHSWKDEWFTILFSLPLVGAFVPSWQAIILDGFNTLQQTPEWYIMLVTGIVAATFGLRWLISRRK
jgi:hypothetical protein